MKYFYVIFPNKIPSRLGALILLHYYSVATSSRDAADGQSSLCLRKRCLGNRWRASWSYWREYKGEGVIQKSRKLVRTQASKSGETTESERLILLPRNYVFLSLSLFNNKTTRWCCQIPFCFHFSVFHVVEHSCVQGILKYKWFVSNSCRYSVA